MLDVRFMAEGTPVPKGNHAAFPIARGRCDQCAPGRSCRRRNCFGGVLIGTTITDDGGDELRAWQDLIRVRAISARNAAGQRLVEAPGAVLIDVVFVMARPGGHWTLSGRLTSTGRARPDHTVKPDRDKLLRAATDGLINALVQDDSQIIAGDTAKVYAPWRGKTGAIFHARQVAGHAEWVARELAHHGIELPKQEALL